MYIPPFKLAQMRKEMEAQGIKPVRMGVEKGIYICVSGVQVSKPPIDRSTNPPISLHPDGWQDKSSKEYQRQTWEALRKSINGLINKVGW